MSDATDAVRLALAELVTLLRSGGDDDQAAATLLDEASAGSGIDLVARHTTSVAEPDEEWSEWSEEVSVRVRPAAVALIAHRNLATMVGASQSDQLVLRAGPDAARWPDLGRMGDTWPPSEGAPAELAARWLETARRVLADPAHRTTASTVPGPRTRPPVVLRQEHLGDDHRYLEARLDEAGDLHVDGQDLGPGTAPVSDDGEYEWFTVIRAAHLPALRTLLGLTPDDDLLDALARHYTGASSYELESRLRQAAFPIERQVWS